MTVTPGPRSAVLERPYAADPDAVLTALGSGPDGLTGELAARRFTEVGPNGLPEPEPESPDFESEDFESEESPDPGDPSPLLAPPLPELRFL